MAKYTASIGEDLRQRILSLPKGVNFTAIMRKAMEVFVEELEKKPDLGPEDFIITVAAGKESGKRKG